MELRIALAGNPNSGKTTLFNALTGSNQFVGNWPGVTVEKKEGKLKRHDGVTITDLPGIYSLSPYTLEEVVARNYLLNQRPDAIINIIDGTNLERNLYLTTQLIELGIPMVIAVNMMDMVRKNGDQIKLKELSRELGCKIIELSALKNEGVTEAAEAAIRAAKEKSAPPLQSFSAPVEEALQKIGEIAAEQLPAEQRRFFTVKLFERDGKVLEQLSLTEAAKQALEEEIQAVEHTLEDDAESIVTNERYQYITALLDGNYKKKNAGALSTSDEIDKVVTNRFLGLPIFAAVMFLVYFISMVGIGSAATDWVNDGVFGDGFHLFSIGTADFEEASEAYTTATLIAEGYNAYVEEHGAAPTGEFAYFAEDEETLEVTEEAATLEDYSAALVTLSEYGEEPDPADYGVWVPGIPVLIEQGLTAANTPDWLSALILDGIVAGVGAVLGFVPQMLVLFYCSRFWKPAGTWRASPLCSTASSANSGFPGNPSFPCSSAPAAAFRASWPPVRSKTSATGA